MRTDSQRGAEFALLVFKVNGQLLAVGDRLARPAGVTVAAWQVLGAVLERPLTASGIAREMGISRQAVQRVANVLREAGLLEARPNPAHRRAPLLAPTDAGFEAVHRIAPAQTSFAERLIAELGRERFEALVTALAEASAAIDRVRPDAAA